MKIKVKSIVNDLDKLAKKETMWLSKPAFLIMKDRRQWFNEGKNWAMSKARVLVDKFLIQPVWMIWVKATPASTVNLNLRPPSWLGWINSFEAVLNWSLSPMTFLMSLPTVLRRTIGLNTLGESYDFLFSLKMTIMVDLLKCEGQYPNLIHMLAILMIILRQLSSLRIILR